LTTNRKRKLDETIMSASKPKADVDSRSAPDAAQHHADVANGESPDAPRAASPGDSEAVWDVEDGASGLEDLSAKLAEAEHRLLLAQADLENYRRRARREMDEERRYAALPLLRDLLPVMDNLDLAMSAMEAEPSAANMKSGLQMVAGQFLATLQRHSCVALNPLHEPFDPHLHEAVGHEPNTDYPPGTVVRVERVGYRMHDRVVRPAAVVVAAQTSAKAGQAPKVP
jgi:molecular chaperone GrpE